MLAHAPAQRVESRVRLGQRPRQPWIDTGGVAQLRAERAHVALEAADGVDVARAHTPPSGIRSGPLINTRTGSANVADAQSAPSALSATPCASGSDRL